MNQRGIAMVSAMLLAAIVSALAVLVINLTFRRFALSAFRTDHMVAEASAEGGFQYAFARLKQDAAFRTAVQAKRDALGRGAIPANNAAAEYVVTCDDTIPVAQRDELVPELHMGVAAAGKHLTLRIRFFHNEPLLGFTDAVPLANRPYRIRSSSSFGTGG